MTSDQQLKDKEDKLEQMVFLMDQCSLEKKELEAELQQVKEAQAEQNAIKEKIQRSNAILLQNVQTRSKELEEINYSLDQRINEEIEKSRKQVQTLLHQSRLIAMGEMIGNIAHQWRQPLNVLGLKIQDIEAAYTYGELNEAYIQEMTTESMKQINYMSKTIDDFRDFVNPNKAENNFEVGACVDDAIKLLKGSLNLSAITIEIEHSSQMARIRGSAGELKQVIVNLLNNSRDAFLETDAKNRHIIITTKSDELNSIITFEDNAGGIPAGVIHRIFEPYFTTKEEGKGTGIGLYMSYMIIHDKMEGNIVVENVRDGVLFTINLPKFYE